MYLDMLERAVRALREGRVPALDRPLAAATEVELHVPALLPDDYVHDVHLRLALYQRIAAADAQGLQDLTSELIDRFGPLPDAAGNFLRLAGLRVTVRALGIRRLELSAAGGSVQFEEQHQIDVGKLILLVQRQAREYRFEGQSKIRITRALPKVEQRFEYAQALLRQLSASSA